MLRKILSISGKPGLYKMVSQGKNMILVESLLDGKRFPAYSNAKIVSLNDISIYTTEDDVPLRDVFTTIFEKNNGAKVDTAQLKSAASIDAFFSGILPNYDKDRVYNSDIKKLAKWYNILIDAGFTNFSEQKDEDSKESSEQGDDAKATAHEESK